MTFYEEVFIIFTKDGKRLYDEEGDILETTYGWDGEFIYKKELFGIKKICRFYAEDPEEYLDTAEHQYIITLDDIAKQSKASRTMIIRNEKKQAKEWAKLCERKGWSGGDFSLYNNYKKATQDSI